MKCKLLLPTPLCDRLCSPTQLSLFVFSVIRTKNFAVTGTSECGDADLEEKMGSMMAIGARYPGKMWERRSSHVRESTSLCAQKFFL